MRQQSIRVIIGLSSVSVITCLMLSNLDAGLITVVVPSNNISVPGSVSFAAPFNPQGDQWNRYQQIYNAVLFGGQSGIVEKIRFRVGHSPEFASFANANFDLLVRLSHSPFNSETMGSDFAPNIGDDETIVLNQVVSLSGTGGQSLNPFDVVLDVADIFSYDGVGNLLLDITVLTGTTTGIGFDAVLSPELGASNMAITFGGRTADNGSHFRGRGLVTAFDIQQNPVPNPIPEPTSLTLLGIGAVSLLGYGLRRKRTLAA